MGKRISVYDNTTIKWSHNGERYCLHIQQDPGAEDPRGFDSNLTEMACFVRGYCLGDGVSEKDSQEFWQRLVWQNVPREEILRTVEEGRLPGIRLAQNQGDPELYDIYEMLSLGKEPEKECLEYAGVSRTAIVDYIVDDLSVVQCQSLMHPYAEFFPVWAYIHSGITISCGNRTYPYNDMWDSGLAGWIVALRHTIIKCISSTAVENEANQPSKKQSENEQSPCDDLSRDMKNDESRWRSYARDVMKQEIEIYDEWLRDNVFGYTLYSAADQGDDSDVADDEDGEICWNEIDSVWGYYGNELLNNGMADSVSHGLREALENGAYHPRCQRGTRNIWA